MIYPVVTIKPLNPRDKILSRNFSQINHRSNKKKSLTLNNNGTFLKRLIYK